MTVNYAAAAQQRALVTRGASAEVIYRLAARAIEEGGDGGALLDVGCGQGLLWSYVSARFERYLGVDLVRYPEFPARAEFCAADLNVAAIPLPAASADVVACIETIEHVENPRALVRELARLVRPGGLVLLTTPNQLSLLSKLTLVVKGQFNAFTASSPGHITALVEKDLLLIARESGLIDAQIRYTDSGRMPGARRHWPRILRGRAFSDNVLLAARRPPASPQGHGQ